MYLLSENPQVLFLEGMYSTAAAVRLLRVPELDNSLLADPGGPGLAGGLVKAARRFAELQRRASRKRAKHTFDITPPS